METRTLWELFVQTGSPEAYLAYKQQLSGEKQTNQTNQTNQGTVL